MDSQGGRDTSSQARPGQLEEGEGMCTEWCTELEKVSPDEKGKKRALVGGLTAAKNGPTRFGLRNIPSTWSQAGVQKERSRRIVSQRQRSRGRRCGTITGGGDGGS
eukprot:2689713-Rhodomonas_salina.2